MNSKLRYLANAAGLIWNTKNSNSQYVKTSKKNDVLTERVSIGGGWFEAGVKVSTVLDAARRLYLYQQKQTGSRLPISIAPSNVLILCYLPNGNSFVGKNVMLGSTRLEQSCAGCAQPTGNICHNHKNRRLNHERARDFIQHRNGAGNFGGK